MAGPAPLIAINGLLEPGKSPRLVLALRYADAVRRAGGVPVTIVPKALPADLECALLLARVDGIVFSGGDDFDVERLGLGPTHPKATPVPPEKQDFDFALARACLERGIPTLGICYGMQLLGLAEGASLLQHLPEDRPGSRNHAGGVEHSVRVVTGTKLAAALGRASLAVVSRHHQALAAVAPPWTVAASDEQGLIEAIERADHPFAVGVQWHPELSAVDSAQGRLFEALIAAAQRHAERRTMLPEGSAAG